MSGLKNAIVTGQSMYDKSASAVTNAATAAAAPTKAEFDAFVGKFNALLAELKANGMIKNA